MKKAPLQVTIRAKQSSVVDLTVGENVQLDRLTPSEDGYVAERAGGLLSPGTTRIAIDQGLYYLKTLSDVHLKVVHGGVDTSASTADKDGDWPDPRKLGAGQAKGDQPSGPTPRLTIG